MLTSSCTFCTSSFCAFFCTTSIKVDLSVGNIEIPSSRTTYWCKAFQLPELDKANHIIGAEVIPDPRHPYMVHHALLYECDFDQLGGGELTFSGDCDGPTMPLPLLLCRVGKIVAAWAVGGVGCLCL